MLERLVVFRFEILIIIVLKINPFTYDHRTLKTRLPVRSALFKQRTGGLVVRWVTTSEYPLLYVFCYFIFVNDVDKERKVALKIPNAVMDVCGVF
jgi:hypothetical protein